MLTPVGMMGGVRGVFFFNPAHPHFSTKLNNLGAIQLPPGERRAFSVVFPEGDTELAVETLVPTVEIKHSEMVRAP